MADLFVHQRDLYFLFNQDKKERLVVRNFGSFSLSYFAKSTLFFAQIVVKCNV